jgi:hypothetical protein
MATMTTFEQVNVKLDSDPWMPRENLHSLTGRRVRYMGTEWAYQGTEWIVVKVDEFAQAHCLKEGQPVDELYPTRFHVSMLDVI